MARRKKQLKLIDQIREAVRDSEVSQYRIALDTGINKSNLTRFMVGRSGLSMESLDALVEYLDLELVPRKQQRS